MKTERLNEELIVIKSLSIHIIMYVVKYILVLSVRPQISVKELFTITNGLLLIFLTLILSTYLIHILFSRLFNDIQFYWRGLILAFLNTILLTFLLVKIDSGNEQWLPYFFGTIYLIFFELPRFGIVVHYDTKERDLKFIDFATKNYVKILILFLALSIILLMINTPDISISMIGLVVLSNLSLSGFLTFLAWRLNSKYHLRKLMHLLKIEGMTLAIVILYGFSLKLISTI